MKLIDPISLNFTTKTSNEVVKPCKKLPNTDLVIQTTKTVSQANGTMINTDSISAWSLTNPTFLRIKTPFKRDSMKLKSDIKEFEPINQMMRINTGSANNIFDSIFMKNLKIDVPMSPTDEELTISPRIKQAGRNTTSKLST